MTSNLNMKAAIIETPGGEFRWVDVQRPKARPFEVLVRICASGVNPLDAKIRAGSAAHAQHPLPAILGIDLAGIIEDVGEDVKGFRRGAEVYGMTGGVGGLQGSLAEYAAVDASLLAPKPSTFSMREAAALPLAFITAWEGLVDRANVRAGQKVLIQGGAGGVGHVAIQIAKSFGADVFATGNSSQAEYITSIGATPIDYTTTEVSKYVDRYTGGRGFDVVYDTGGGTILDASFAAVCRFGHVVSCLGWGSHSLVPLSFKSATYSGVFTLHPLLTGEGRKHYGEIIHEATKLAEAGKLIPRLDPRIFTLNQTTAAHEAMADRSAKGKLVVTI